MDNISDQSLSELIPPPPRRAHASSGFLWTVQEGEEDAGKGGGESKRAKLRPPSLPHWTSAERTRVGSSRGVYHIQKRVAASQKKATGQAVVGEEFGSSDEEKQATTHPQSLRRSSLRTFYDARGIAKTDAELTSLVAVAKQRGLSEEQVMVQLVEKYGLASTGKDLLAQVFGGSSPSAAAVGLLPATPASPPTVRGLESQRTYSSGQLLRKKPSFHRPPSNAPPPAGSRIARHGVTVQGNSRLAQYVSAPVTATIDSHSDSFAGGTDEAVILRSNSVGVLPVQAVRSLHRDSSKRGVGTMITRMMPDSDDSDDNDDSEKDPVGDGIEWYVQLEEIPAEPVSEEQLKSWYADGTADDETMIWFEGIKGGAWASVGDACSWAIQWERLVDPATGDEYYCDPVQGVVTWERPVDGCIQ